jgi:hypothetical protein
MEAMASGHDAAVQMIDTAPAEGRPLEDGLELLQAVDQPTYATLSWARASAAVAGWAGSCSTVAS